MKSKWNDNFIWDRSKYFKSFTAWIIREKESKCSWTQEPSTIISKSNVSKSDYKMNGNKISSICFYLKRIWFINSSFRQEMKIIVDHVWLWNSTLFEWGMIGHAVQLELFRGHIWRKVLQCYKKTQLIRILSFPGFDEFVFTLKFCCFWYALKTSKGCEFHF